MNKRVVILLHVAVWVLMFITPLTYMRGYGFSLLRYLMMCASPLLLMIVFYLNYLWLTPHYFVKGKHRYYLLVNLVMVVCLGIALHYWMTFVHSYFEAAHHLPPRNPMVLDSLFFILRDIFNLVVAAGIATTIVLAMRWQHSEEARLEAEAARAEAELRNLRSQINPHFLLNTLNNIYALTAFDAPKAQEAIQQLSKMLRHMLYDNQETEVALKDEMQFLENYISLMRIRLPQHVEVRFTQDIANPDKKVAPLILISLVENAFKHGVSPTERSFIHIDVVQQASSLTVKIENSNHPKTERDRSGHGIGLQQVQKRLDLSYPGRYQWEKGVSGATYYSHIAISL